MNMFVFHSIDQLLDYGLFILVGDLKQVNYLDPLLSTTETSLSHVAWPEVDF